MPFTKLQFNPGINRDRTSYSNEGGWYDCDKVRFKEGFPETIGGWEKLSNSTFLGTCRALHPWATLTGNRLMGVGTHLKYYILEGSDFTDVTPIRSTTSAGDVTFSATTGSSVIEVSDTGHGALIDDFVTYSGAASLGGAITAGVLNVEHQITEIVDADTYKIDVGVAATSSDTGDGGTRYVQAFSVAAQETSPTDVFFKPDGTKMYVVGVSGDDVNEYDLSSAWDVSTASYLQNFSVSAQETAPSGISFKPDGTKMYVVGTVGDSVNEYDLSSAWDISSASYLQAFSVSAEETGPTGLFFKPDGTKMYIVGVTGDDVNEYDLSSAWDVSSASYLQVFSVAAQETAPTDVFFKSDGTKMYVVGTVEDTVFEYALSSAWDVSTASYLQSFSVLAQDTGPNGFFFKPDGTKMYVVGFAGDDVNEYDLASAWSAASSTVGEYQINVGLDASFYGTGWGAGAWSSGAWGAPSTTSIAGAQLRLWSHDNFGEDLLTCVRDGGIYYWDSSGGVSARAVALSSLVGSQKAPTIAKQVLVSDRDRHVIAFGCDGEFSIGTQDPLLIRFSDQESLIEWRSQADTTAGSLRIGSGSEIICAVETKQQVLVFTDVSLHAMQYIGPPFTFGIGEIATSVSIVSPNAAVAANEAVFWMGIGDFYFFDGTVKTLPCPVSEYVFSDFNADQRGKVFAAHNADFSEVWWFYPCSQSENCSRYVAYDYGQNAWHYGVLSRTAWIPRGVFTYPVAAGADNYLYYHEIGVNDGSQNPAVGISAYIESSPMDMGDGDRAMFVRRVIPDITFRGSEGSPSATLTLKAQNYPGGGFDTSTANAVTRTATVPVEKFTTEQYVRLRGRAMSLRVESDQYNTAWRLGSPRVDVRSDGGR